MLLGTALISMTASADLPTRQDVREARRFYNSAKRSLRKNDILTALVHLKDAENKHPIYKYAAALATTHLRSNQPVLAWEAANRAKKYGVPKQKERRFTELSQTIEAQLLQTHAFLALTVVPTTASVRIGNEQWLPPYKKWVPRNFSVLELEAPAYAPKKVKWHHPTGNKATRTILMEPASNFGQIEVTGSPAGASVYIDGKRLGTLPQVNSGLLKPGEYTVSVENNGFIASERQTLVRKGVTTPITMELEPTESDLVKSLKSKTMWGWTAVGVGGAALITGIGLLAHSAVLIDDVNTLNRTHITGFDDYLREYDKKAADIPTFGAAGWSMLAVGLALGATGATLLVLEYQEKADGASISESPAARPPVTVRLTPALTGASATVSF